MHCLQNDSEFEMKLKVQMAIDRIPEGEEALGSIWKQMTEIHSNTYERT